MGTVVGGTYYYTESGLTSVLDKISGAIDLDAANRGQVRGLAMGRQAGLTPADAPPQGLFARLIAGVTGSGGQQQPAPATAQAAPVAPAAAPAVQPVGRPMPGFDSAVGRTMAFEGGLNPSDANGTPSNMGINQAAHPDVDVASLTPDAAKGIYRQQYWDAIGADSMPPALARAAFDTAVIAGPQKAQQLVAQSGGDPMKLMDLRQQFQQSLILADPQKYGQYGKAWQARNNGLRLDIAALNATGGAAPAGAPADTMAYAPSSDPSSPTAAAAPSATGTGPDGGSAPMMPLATASTNASPTPQPAHLMTPRTPPPVQQQQQAQLPQQGQPQPQQQASGVAQQPTLDDIKQLVLEPQTRAYGLQLWQQMLAPKSVTFGKPGDVPFINGRAGTPIPAAPVAVREGGALVDPSNPSRPLFTNPKTETGTFQAPDGTTYSFDKSNPGAAPIRLTPPGSASGYRPANADERKALGVGPTTPLFFGPDGKPSTLAGGTQVTVNNAVNPILKGLGDQFVTGAEEARASGDTIRAVQSARTQLQGGIFSGALADQQLALQKLGRVLGVGDADKIVNTETFRTQIKPIVLSTVKGLGAGSGISNADRDFAEAAVGGKITLDGGTIGRVLDITERAARAKIDRHNTLADQMLKTQPDLGAVAPMLHITPPPISGQAAPQPAAQDMSPVGQARAAIAAGAPRDQVLQRLQQQGVDVSGQGL